MTAGSGGAETGGREAKVGEAVMVRVQGKPWRCQCGANVLTKDPYTGWLTCNGCQTTYAGAS